MRAVESIGADKFAIAGGVAANTALREAMKEACERTGDPILPIRLRFICTDNAAMIGAAALL